MLPLWCRGVLAFQKNTGAFLDDGGAVEARGHAARELATQISIPQSEEWAAS